VKYKFLFVLWFVVCCSFSYAETKVSWKSYSQSSAGKWGVVAKYPKLTGDRLSGFAFADIEKSCKLWVDKVAKESKRTWSPIGGRRIQWDFQRQSYVSVVSSDLISLYYQDFIWTGGAHPNTNYVCSSYGYVNGKPVKLELKNLFKSGTDVRKVVSNIVIPKLKNMGAQWVVDGEMKECSDDNLACFVLTPTTVTFLFPPYAAGPYAQGEFVVKVAFAEFGDSLDRSGPIRSLLSGE
jgi:hypothetical protein